MKNILMLMIASAVLVGCAFTGGTRTSCGPKKSSHAVKQVEAVETVEVVEEELVVVAGLKNLEKQLFAHDSAVIVDRYKPELNELARFLHNNPTKTVVISGYTDSVGSDAYNLGLSDRRANAVKTYLIHQRVAGNRITAKGYGESNPVASNATKEGRQQNRRTIIDIK